MLLMVAVLLQPGCSYNKPTDIKKIVYDVNRPEWIKSSCTKNIPEEIRNKPVEAVKTIGGQAWLGITDFGLARYDFEPEKWTLYPVETSQKLSIKSIIGTEKTIYCATSGLGLLIFEPETGRARFVSRPKNKAANRLSGIAHFKDRIWYTSSGGLYIYNIADDSVEQIDSRVHRGVSRWKNQLWAIRYHPGELPALRLFDMETGDDLGEWQISDSYYSLPIISADENTVVISTLNGVLLFDKAKKTFTPINKPESFPQFITKFLYRFGDRHLAGTFTGIASYDSKTKEWLYIDRNSGIPKSPVLSMDSYRDKLIIGFGCGVFIAGPDEWEQLAYIARERDRGKSESESIGHSAEDTYEWIHLTVQDNLQHNMLFAIAANAEEAWIGSQIYGLTRISLEDLSVSSYFPESTSGSRPFVTPIMEIQLEKNLVWHAGYFRWGIFDTDKKEWIKDSPLHEEIKDSNAEALWISPDKTWMGIRKEGLRVLDRKTNKWEYFKGDNFMLSKCLTDIVKSGNTILLASDMGISKYNYNKKNFDVVKAGIFDIESMISEGDTLWIGTRERSRAACESNTGFFSYNLRTRHKMQFNRIFQESPKCINRIYVDGPIVWIASQEGVFTYNRMTGRLKRFSKESGLEAGDYLSITVGGNKILVGTDEGLFINDTIRFNRLADKKTFVAAWQLEQDGKYLKAAETYSKLPAHGTPSLDNIIKYRIAKCMELGGDVENALILYRELLIEYPLLILDLESIFSSVKGYIAYLDMIYNTMEKYEKDSFQRRLCETFISNTDIPLKRLAINAEKRKNFKGASEYWQSILESNASGEAREEAASRLRRLISENLIPGKQ